ncbi:HNH endonuclease signature motif containing protein [Parafrigoribacterium mesophilum]|uniref:HNH endonuclease signature motif containing protein n=1 Tax=Parafrigoribacterium mesophilum TaxID=433646 RepID=UPI0031FE272F
MGNPTTAELETITEQVAAVLDPRELAGMSEDDLLAFTAAAERLGRRVDALRVLAAGEVAEASRNELGKSGLAARKGCRNTTELLERVTHVSSDTARKRMKTGRAIRGRLSLAGERLPAEFSVVAGALVAGTIGVDSAHAIIQGLTAFTHPVGKDVLQAAETELVAAACGATELSPVPCTADDIRSQAGVWRMFLDQDGSQPLEEQAMRQRFLHLSRERDGLVGIRGALLPDVAAKLTTIMDACLSPKTAPAFLSVEEAMAAGRDADPRTRDQQRHDVFAAVVDVAARSLQMPQLGGAAPVVAVAVTLDNLQTGTGCGYIGEVPISMRAVNQFTCTGGVQKIVFDHNGRILELGSPERIFTAQQRRAIILRDGECCTPGCHMPGALSEIHHVEAAADGGPTHTDNGMILCWFHHRTLDTSGWEFRMVNGLPEVKYPPWLDNTGKWYPTGRSATLRQAKANRKRQRQNQLI